MSGNKKWVTVYRNAMCEKPGMKTCVFIVETKTGETLGTIRWYGAWRGYAFFPESDTLYEKQCLRDIADYLDEIRSVRREP